MSRPRRPMGAMGALAALVAALVLAPAAMAVGATRNVALTGSDTLNSCTSAAHPCRHIAYAVFIANPGDTVKVATGTYVEQVAIAKNLTLIGAGRDTTTVQAPASMVADGTGQTYVVSLDGGANVSVSSLTVAGPGAPGGGSNCALNPLSLDKGIVVQGGASLTLSGAAVRNVFDQPQSGCQRGDAISVGNPCFSCTGQVGHAVVSNVVVSAYQKNGVAVRGSGSTLKVTGSTITNTPMPQIASNGVEVLAGASGYVAGNKISGNQCQLTPTCGPDFTTQTQASGVLLIDAAAGTIVGRNQVTANDIGIYAANSAGQQTTLTRNTVTGGFEGIVVDSGTSGVGVGYNLTQGANLGILVPAGSSGNAFAHNFGRQNAVYDFSDANPAGANVFHDNHCKTAFPSRKHWDCEALPDLTPLPDLSLTGSISIDIGIGIGIGVGIGLGL